MLTALLTAQDIADEILNSPKGHEIEMTPMGFAHHKRKLSKTSDDVFSIQNQDLIVASEAVDLQNPEQPIKKAETQYDDDENAFQPTLNNQDSDYGLLFPEFGHDYLLMAILRSPPWVNNAQIQTLVDKLLIANLTKNAVVGFYNYLET